MVLNSRWAVAAVAALLTVALTLPAHAWADSAKASDELRTSQKSSRTLAARVNGQPIYEDQLTPLVEAELSKLNKFGSAAKPSNDHLLQIKKQALEEILPGELFYQAAQDLVIPDVDERIAKKVAEFQKLPPSLLEDKSDAELSEFARRQIYVNEYMEQNDLLHPQVPEEEIKEFYEKGKHTYVAKESIHVRHILVQVQEGATAEERQASRERIDKAAKLILAGKPFDEVATEYSEDNAASAGGDIGFVERGFMPPEFDQVAFTIEPGQVSDIVETQFGYHILEVLEKTPEGIAPYEKMQDFLGKFLQEQLQKKMVTTQVQSLRDKAQIEIFLK